MLARLFAIIVGILGGGAFSQLPEFSQQYRQRICGAIDELSRVVARFELDSRAVGLTRTQAMDKLRTAGEEIARRQADAAAARIGRLDTLTQQRADMRTAGAFGRVVSLAASGDRELARETWRDFEPAVPVTFEGFAFAAAGYLGGWLAMMLGAHGARRWRAWRIRPVPARS